MDQIQMLIAQTQSAYDWTNKLLNGIPHEKWDFTPEVIASNVSWQAGHLIMSFYYHSIMVIAGHQMDILQKVPLKEYDGLFTDAAPYKAIGKTNPSELQDQLQLIEQKSIEIIRSLPLNQLESQLVPTPIQHPVARNKREALDWNIKHTMWHCGQLGMLKRIIDERFDFGLRTTK